MVENTTAFESSSSFSGDDSVLSESQEGEEFDMVSHTASDIHSASSDGQVFMRNGILIVDGSESTTRDGASESVLSIPGTYSLPTDVGTLQGREVMFANHGARKNAWKIPKHVAVAFVSILCFFVYDTYNWRAAHLKLQEQVQAKEATIQRLEKEVEESKMLIQYTDDSEYVTLVDNCWIQAKAKWCDRRKPFKGGLSLPHIFGEAIGEASKLVSKKVNSIKEAMHELPHSASSDLRAATDAVGQASDALSVFVGAAGEAMAAELNEFADSPLDYVTEAVKGASQNNKSRSGATNTESSTTNGDWGKAFKRTAVKVTEAMDDPLSYFEYETS
eukprot:scaffold1951_cov100-Cylindrotheca_fusiformis.AAC.2